MINPDSKEYRRFTEALLYIAQKSSDNPDFGRTLLFKALVYADILCMAAFGHTITNWKYMHFENGPVPLNGDKVIEALKNQNAIQEFEIPLLYGRSLKRIVPLRDVNTSLFSRVELSLMDMAVGFMSRYSATEASDFSLKLPAWRYSESDKRIDEYLLKFPYLVEEVELSASEMSEAIASAREQGLSV